MAFDLDDEELRATRERFGLKEIEDTKDIIIDNMAKFIAERDIDEDICKNENGKLCGDILDDVDVKESESRYITPVPGGVGPMTVANLMYNTSK